MRITETRASKPFPESAADSSAPFDDTTTNPNTTWHSAKHARQSRPFRILHRRRIASLVKRVGRNLNTLRADAPTSSQKPSKLWRQPLPKDHATVWTAQRIVNIDQILPHLTRYGERNSEGRGPHPSLTKHCNVGCVKPHSAVAGSAVSAVPPPSFSPLGSSPAVGSAVF